MTDAQGEKERWRDPIVAEVRRAREARRAVTPFGPGELSMDEPALKVPDTEQERQQLLDKLTADHGPHSTGQYEPGSFGCHELLDRTALAADIVERYVRTHPACVRNREWFALAEQAATALHELYQRIGAAHLDDK